MNNLSATQKIEESFLEGKNDKLFDVAINQVQELFTLVVDRLLKTAIFKDIPIINIIVALMKEGKAISDAIYARKILLFLIEFDKTSENDRRIFLKKLNGKSREKLVEKIMLVLEKHDDYQKSQIQGKLTKALVEGILSQDEYFKLTYATNMIDIESIKYLLDFYGANAPRRIYNMTETQKYNFLFLQLININAEKAGFINMITQKQEQIEYRTNELGKKYVELIRE